MLPPLNILLIHYARTVVRAASVSIRQGAVKLQNTNYCSVAAAVFCGGCSLSGVHVPIPKSLVLHTGEIVRVRLRAFACATYLPQTFYHR